MDRNGVRGTGCKMDKSQVLCRVSVFALILSRHKTKISKLERKFQGTEKQ